MFIWHCAFPLFAVVTVPYLYLRYIYILYMCVCVWVRPVNANLHFRMYICCDNQIYIDIYKHYCIVVDTIITFSERIVFGSYMQQTVIICTWRGESTIHQFVQFTHICNNFISQCAEMNWIVACLSVCLYVVCSFVCLFVIVHNISHLQTISVESWPTSITTCQGCWSSSTRALIPLLPSSHRLPAVNNCSIVCQHSSPFFSLSLSLSIGCLSVLSSSHLAVYFSGK